MRFEEVLTLISGSFLFLWAQVSWIKVDAKGNLKLLTVDQVTYSTDSMYSLQFLPPNNFQLKLIKLTTGTSGEYHCQISSHPPKLLRYNLNVVGELEALFSLRTPT